MTSLNTGPAFILLCIKGLGGAFLITDENHAVQAEPAIQNSIALAYLNTQEVELRNKI